MSQLAGGIWILKFFVIVSSAEDSTYAKIQADKAKTKEPTLHLPKLITFSCTN